MSDSQVGRRTYAPLRRILALLHFLTYRHRENPHRVYTHAQLLAALTTEYENGPAAERTLRGDLQALRNRGLVRTNLPHPEHVRLRGVQRNAMVEKSAHLRLSVEEHQVLQEVRGRLGGRQPRVAPTIPPTTPQGRANVRVEDALLLVRLLEEACGEVEVNQVAAALGVGHQQARRWLEEVWDVFGETFELRSSSGDAEDYDTARLTVGDRTLVGHGADLLGLFPYSAEEAHERLVVLDDFEASEHAGEVAAETLTTIRSKLERWLVELNYNAPL